MIDVSVHLTGDEAPAIRTNAGESTGRPFVVVQVAGVSVFLHSIDQAQALSDTYAGAASALMAMAEPKQEA